MEPRFRLQETWLGCNGIVSLAALVLAAVVALLAAAAYLARRAVAVRAESARPCPLSTYIA
jgi:hypothetical protein